MITKNINGRKIEITEKSMKILRNEEDLQYNSKFYGSKRIIQESLKVRDEIESTENFKQIINELKGKGHKITRVSPLFVSDEDIDTYIEMYKIE